MTLDLARLKDNLIEMASAASADAGLVSPLWGGSLYRSDRGWGVVWKITYLIVDNFLDSRYESESMEENSIKTLQTFLSLKNEFENVQLNRLDRSIKIKAVELKSLTKVLMNASGKMNRFFPDQGQFLKQVLCISSFYEFELLTRRDIPWEAFKPGNEDELRQWFKQIQVPPFGLFDTSENHQIYLRKAASKLRKLTLHIYQSLYADGGQWENFYYYVQTVAQESKKNFYRIEDIKYQSYLRNLPIGAPFKFSSGEYHISQTVKDPKRPQAVQERSDRSLLFAEFPPFYPSNPFSIIPFVHVYEYHENKKVALVETLHDYLSETCWGRITLPRMNDIISLITQLIDCDYFPSPLDVKYLGFNESGVLKTCEWTTRFAKGEASYFREIEKFIYDVSLGCRGTFYTLYVKTKFYMQPEIKYFAKVFHAAVWEEDNPPYSGKAKAQILHYGRNYRKAVLNFQSQVIAKAGVKMSNNFRELLCEFRRTHIAGTIMWPDWVDEAAEFIHKELGKTDV